MCTVCIDADMQLGLRDIACEGKGPTWAA